MHDGTEDGWRTHGAEGEVGLLGGHKVPGCSLGEGLGGTVSIAGAQQGFCCGNRIPVVFAIGVVPGLAFRRVYDRREGGCYDDVLYGGSIFLDGFEDAWKGLFC